MSKTLFFVDVRSMYYATLHGNSSGGGTKVNYKAMLELMRMRHSDLVAPRAYCSFSDPIASTKFLDAIKRIGFEVKEYPPVQDHKTSHCPPAFYVGFVADMVAAIIDDEEVENVIVATENPHFAPILTWLSKEVNLELWTFSPARDPLKSVVPPENLFMLTPECLLASGKGSLVGGPKL